MLSHKYTDANLQLEHLKGRDAFLDKGIPINEKDIVQDDPFDRAPDEEDYEGYIGNAGSSATHFYRNSCRVLQQEGGHTYLYRGQPSSLSDGAHGVVARAALQLRRPELFESAASVVKGSSAY